MVQDSKINYMRIMRKTFERIRLSGSQIQNVEHLIKAAGLSFKIERIENGFVTYFGNDVTTEILVQTITKILEKYQKFQVDSEEMSNVVLYFSPNNLTAFFTFPKPSLYSRFLADLIIILSEVGRINQQNEIREIEKIMEDNEKSNLDLD